MGSANIFIIGIIVTLTFVIGIWLTFSEFTTIEDGETDRRKHLEEDMKIND